MLLHLTSNKMQNSLRFFDSRNWIWKNFEATFFEYPRMEVGIQTVMKFGYECTSLQMAVYCETFKGTKNVQCYNLVIKWLDICFWLPVKSKFRQPTFVPLAIAESCTETLKNNNKLHKNRAWSKMQSHFWLFICECQS